MFAAKGKTRMIKNGKQRTILGIPGSLRNCLNSFFNRYFQTFISQPCLEILDTYNQQKDHHAGQDGELLGDRLKAGSLDHYLLHHDDEPLGRDDVGEHLKSDRHALAREYDAGQHHGRHCQSHTAQQHRCLLCLGED